MLKKNIQEFSSVFIIPHYADGYEGRNGKRLIAETIEGLFSHAS